MPLDQPYDPKFWSDRFDFAREGLLLADLGYLGGLSLNMIIHDRQPLSAVPEDLANEKIERLLMINQTQLLCRRGFGAKRLFGLTECYEEILSRVSSSDDGPFQRQANRLLGSEQGPDYSLSHDQGRERLESLSTHLVDPTLNLEDDSLRIDEAAIREGLKTVGLWFHPVGRGIPSMRECGWNIGSMSFDALFEKYSWAEIMGGKRKRLGCVAQLFSRIPQFVSISNDLGVAIEPVAAQILLAKSTIREILNSRRSPTQDELSRGVIAPLLEQVEVDCGPESSLVAKLRLGLGHRGRLFRDIASEMGISNARVGQLLKRAQGALLIRWREGEYLFDDLCELLQRGNSDFDSYRLCYRVFEVFYPDRLALKQDAVPVAFGRDTTVVVEDCSPQSKLVRTIEVDDGDLVSDIHPAIRKLMRPD